MDISCETESNEFRHEIKFICDLELATKLTKYFGDYGFMKAYPDRQVNSVYYDSINFKCAEDNLAGISPRKKFRLRWYSSAKQKFFGLTFETKIKVGRLGTKKRKSINHISQDHLSLGSVLKLDKQLKVESDFVLPSGLDPKLIVSYERSYLTLTEGVRMTIDDKLNFQEFNHNNFKQMFLPDNSRRSSSFGSFKIIELKWGIEKTEPLSKLLKSLPSPPVRCSKYLLGLSRTRGLSYL